MKRLFGLLLFFIVSCGPGPEQLWETAELELLQTNYRHASQLYREILEKHPDSSLAGPARTRLREIQARQEENGRADGN